MSKNDIQLKMLYKFLSLFNLSTMIKDNNKVIYDLKSGKTIILHDDCLNPIGRVYISCEEEIIIEAMFKDYCFFAIGNNEDTDEVGYKYTLKNYDSSYEIKGEYKTQKGIKLDGLIIKNSMVLYQNGINSGKCIFDTLKNNFKMHNPKTKNFVKYINNEFCHNNNEKFIRIDNEYGNFIYQVISDKEDENICGYSFLNKSGKLFDYTSCELEFRRIIEEIDDEYFGFLKSQKELFNLLQHNLFENMACVALKNFNRKQLDAMLDIDFSKFSNDKTLKK